MAYNEALTNKIRERLLHLPDVEEKKMFRGVTFMVNGKMCITAGDDKLMFRVDPDLHDELVEKGRCETVIMKGKPYRGYLYVRESDLTTNQQWDYWIGLALEFNKKAKATKKKG